MFLSLADRDKATGLTAARRFAELGFTIVATAGTAAACEAAGIPVEAVVAKLREESGARRVRTSASTPSTSSPPARSTWWSTRPGAAAPGPTAPTSASPPAPTVCRASPPWPPPVAAAAGIADWRRAEHRVRSLQEYHQDAQLRLPLLMREALACRNGPE